MSLPREENKVAGEGIMSNLMQLNRLTYRTPPSLSIASQRRYVENYAQQRNYASGETMVFNINTGTQLIDAKRSYMTFTVTGTGGTIGDFGSGSALNLFQNVRVKSRSGVEICRVQGANILGHVYQRYNCPKDAFSTVLQAQGYGTGTEAKVNGSGTVLASGLQVVIPWENIAPVFRQNRLLPSQLCDGMILEIDLAPVAVALFCSSVGNEFTGYTISLLKNRIDAYDLADAFDRKIAEMAARDGLNLVHKEFYQTLNSSSGTTYNYDVRKSASKALAVYVVPRESKVLTDVKLDSMVTEANKLKQYQFSAGNVYYPNAPMTLGNGTTSPAVSSAEAYYYTLASWHKTDCRNDQDVSLFNYASDAVVPQMGIASTSMIKSQVSDLAGIMINSARSLTAEVIFNDSQDRRLDTWLCFARNVKVYLENTVIAD